MKIKTPQISWHSREPIYSVDFHKSGRIATAGSESDVKVNIEDIVLLIHRYGNTTLTLQSKLHFLRV